MLHLLYAAATRWRRQHAAPRRLSRPVISIGNIAVGGRAKTPMAALVARVLMDAGERPAILSRGYGRAKHVDAPVIVRDADAVRASLDESGDEPVMLAGQLPGAIVVVAADRARAGVAAEALGATVHILDDGFQHHRVARDIDIVMLGPDDLDDEVMPTGRLREPIDALAHADAVVVIGADAPGREYGAGHTFRAARRVSPPPADAAATRGFLVSGIAGNSQFAQGARDAGWMIAGEKAYEDHHRYSSADVDEITRRAADAGAAYVVTTAKDAVRLRALWRAEVPLHVAELTLEIEQRAQFDQWLTAALTEARELRARLERDARRDGPRRAS